MADIFNNESFYKVYTNNELLVLIVFMALSYYPIIGTVKYFLLPRIKSLIAKKNQTYKNILDKHKLTNHVVRLFLAIYLVFWGDVFDKSGLINSVAIRIKDIVIISYIIVTVTSLLLTLINIGSDLYNAKAVSKKVPIELHTQILRIFIVICAILAIFSLVLSISISSLFTSIGAATALLTFVFKDTILGLLASLQVTFQNIIQVGDWVTLPQYNADGDIIKITITVVVIRNFDNTYTTVPTSVFLTTGVKNWRPMFDSGGRRIKRSISIDMDTVKICDQSEIKNIRKLEPMQSLVQESPSIFDETHQSTNLTMFRYYIKQYLRSNQDIHQDKFAFLVRTLDPTPNGIPIEIYVFTKDTAWESYEEVQASIFEHLLGMMPCFKLKAFQSIVK